VCVRAWLAPCSLCRQIDGEPWIQSQPCVVEVQRRGAATVLVPLARSGSEDTGVDTASETDTDGSVSGDEESGQAFRQCGEVLKWAQTSGVISPQQCERLQEELDRRRQQANDYGPHAGTAQTV
jgi:hypothetical protein